MEWTTGPTVAASLRAGMHTEMMPVPFGFDERWTGRIGCANTGPASHRTDVDRHDAIIAQTDPPVERRRTVRGPRSWTGEAGRLPCRPRGGPASTLTAVAILRPKCSGSSRATEGPGPATSRQPACDPSTAQAERVHTRCQCPSDEEIDVDFVSGLRCRECGRTYPAEALHVCDFCFGPLEVTYDYERVAATMTRERIAAGPRSIWRYADLLPVSDSSPVDLGRRLHPVGPGRSAGRRAGTG